MLCLPFDYRLSPYFLHFSSSHFCFFRFIFAFGSHSSFTYFDNFGNLCYLLYSKRASALYLNRFQTLFLYMYLNGNCFFRFAHSGNSFVLQNISTMNKMQSIIIIIAKTLESELSLFTKLSRFFFRVWNFFFHFFRRVFFIYFQRGQ